MSSKRFCDMDNYELRKAWNKFKLARANEAFKHHSVAVKHPDWISCVQREKLINVLIDKL